MIRITTLLWVALLVVAGGTVMNVSYQVRHLERHIAQVAKETRQEQGVIRVLTAEWETLNDPRRVDDLSKRYLTLGPTPIQRVVALDAIPLMPTDEQLAKAAGTGSAKGVKDHGSAKPPGIFTAPVQPNPSVRLASAKQTAPTVHSSAPTPALNRPALDGVGLILARLERHE